MTNSLETNLNQVKRIALVLLTFSIICLFIGGIRIQVSGNMKGFFLVWNLFLAWIPFLISIILKAKETKIHLFKLVLYLSAWLLFLPNAPYIITDFIHLRPRDGIPLWFDAVTIFFFAFHGLLLGVISSLLIQDVIEKYTTKVLSWAFLIVSFVLSGYGIYLGRFLRWNSWDILVNPLALLAESFQQLTNPTAMAVTAIFSSFLFFSYLLFYQLIHLKK